LSYLQELTARQNSSAPTVSGDDRPITDENGRTEGALDVFTKIILSLQLLVLVLCGGVSNRTDGSVSWFLFLVAIQISKSFSNSCRDVGFS
jgi:hypothetical protein